MTPDRRPASGLEHLLGPRALFIALVTAAVLALTGVVTSHTFAAVAIVLFGVAGLAIRAYTRSHTSERLRRVGLASLAVLALGGSCYVAYTGLRDLTSRDVRAEEADVRAEEALVEELSAGQDIQYFTDRLGSPTTKRRDGAFRIYQFQRDRAFLQATTRASGEVTSYAVYSTVDDFHPHFRRAGITLNRSVIHQSSTTGLGSADKANAYCGANRAGLWVSFGTSNAFSNRTFVLGVYSTNGFEISVDRLCKVLPSLTNCIPYLGSAVTRDVVSCFETSPAMEEFLHEQTASVFIETSPGRILTDAMLHTPDVAANLPD